NRGTPQQPLLRNLRPTVGKRPSVRLAARPSLAPTPRIAWPHVRSQGVGYSETSAPHVPMMTTRLRSCADMWQLDNAVSVEDVVPKPIRGGPKQYYVLGDNRSVSQDSRDFGPVPRAAIFARLILIYWPLGRFGTPGYNKN